MAKFNSYPAAAGVWYRKNPKGLWNPSPRTDEAGAHCLNNGIVEYNLDYVAR